MKKVILLILLFPIVLAAQKRTEESIALRYSIEPLKKLPTYIVTYKTELIVPFEIKIEDVEPVTNTQYAMPTSSSLNDESLSEKERVAQKYLSLSNPNFRTDQNEDLTITLSISDITTNNLIKEFSEAQGTDVIATVNYTARLTLSNKGILLLDTNVIIKQDQELTKDMLLFDPFVKAMINIDKGNPQKQRESLELFVRKNKSYFVGICLENSQKIIKSYYVNTIGGVELSICGTKGKDDYTELNKTVVDISTVIKRLYGPKDKRSTPEEINAAFKIAVPIWLKELATLNETDDKARINKEIGDGLEFNLAIAFFWLKDFKKALEYMNKIEDATRKNGQMVTEYSFRDKAQKFKKVLLNLEPYQNQFVFVISK